MFRSEEPESAVITTVAKFSSVYPHLLRQSPDAILVTLVFKGLISLGENFLTEVPRGYEGKAKSRDVSSPAAQTKKRRVLDGQGEGMREDAFHRPHVIMVPPSRESVRRRYVFGFAGDGRRLGRVEWRRRVSTLEAPSLEFFWLVFSWLQPAQRTEWP